MFYSLIALAIAGSWQNRLGFALGFFS
jgi:hypothetical protein